MVLHPFTTQHKLQDAEEQYLQAVYSFRDAENKKSPSYAVGNCKMNLLEADLFRLRQLIYSKSTCFMQKRKRIDQCFFRCPEPAWGG